MFVFYYLLYLYYYLCDNKQCNFSIPGVPRDGARAGAAQPLPAGVPRRSVLVVRVRARARAPAALPRRLRVLAQQVLLRAQRAARARHRAVALEGPAHHQRRSRAQGPRLPRPAPVTHDLPPPVTPHSATGSTDQLADGHSRLELELVLRLGVSN